MERTILNVFNCPRPFVALLGLTAIALLGQGLDLRAADGDTNTTMAPVPPSPQPDLPLAIHAPEASLRQSQSADNSGSSSPTTTQSNGVTDSSANVPITAASTPTSGVAPTPALPPKLEPLPSSVPSSTSAVPASQSPTGAPPASTSAAQAPAAASDPDAANPWKRSFISLITRLVQRGALTKADSDDIISQTQQDANTSRAQATAALATPATQPSVASAVAPTSTSVVASALTDDTVHVNYVPETVKDEMREEIKQDVINHERQENWAGNSNTSPDTFPRFHVFGDIRVRAQEDIVGDDNGQSPDNPTGNLAGLFPNFNAINTGSPFDMNANSNPAFQLPSLNVNQDRFLPRLRARFGVDVNLGQGFSAGLRVGTGIDNSPVTQNQTLGATTNGQGGDFSKYAIWLDRAFIKYELFGRPEQDLSFTIGRMDNPFFSTSMIWEDNIGFDGVATQGKYQVIDGVTLFGAAGAFAVFNTDLNFSSVNADKYPSEDKWLFAGQAGAIWKINEDFTAKGAVAFYDFENIAGQVSSPYVQTNQSDPGNTDDSRPSFAQNGNTYIALRNVEANPALPPGQTPLYEYFGLATGFQVLALTGQLDINHFDPFHIWLTGEFVDNVAFDRNAIVNNGPPGILTGPQNNISNGNDPNSFYGGNQGYNIKLNMGKAALEKFGDWNVNLTYRYVETDAVVDGFVDSDFGGALTGTNLQGYVIGGNLALSPLVFSSLRWLSSQEIAGPTYKSNVIQFDITAKF